MWLQFSRNWALSWFPIIYSYLTVCFHKHSKLYSENSLYGQARKYCDFWKKTTTSSTTPRYYRRAYWNSSEDVKKARQLTFADFFLRLWKDNIKRKTMLVWLKTKAKLVLNLELSWHFFPICGKGYKMKHQENITSHNHGCNYIKLLKGSLMNMFNKYRNKHRKKPQNSCECR